MAEQRRILALPLNVSEQWIAGAYYIFNIIKALNLLDDREKPFIVILAPDESNFELAKKETSYPYLSYTKTGYANDTIPGFFNRVSSKLLNRKIFVRRISVPIDVLYPAWQNKEVTNAKKKIFWIPDFQEHYLPGFFPEEEIAERKRSQRYIADNAEHLILSSEDARKDFQKFYPDHKCRVDVLPFAVSNSFEEGKDIRQVLGKYKINAEYIFIANQMWMHKNNLCVLEAVKILKNEGVELMFVFSGSTNDYRSAGYFQTVLEKVKELGIEKNVKFLGFIDREDQLMLMKRAMFLVQPSLFEGWSTVVEDAKSLNQHIIVSDLEVHKEQLVAYPHLQFDRTSSLNLAEKIRIMLGQKDERISYDYELQLKKFAKAIVEKFSLS
ncbi:MAG TPA: glycosyltransferase [Chitinophagaceae bacterium]|nr:glycosyltransferase [Chitinophagaceae bacterium]